MLLNELMIDHPTNQYLTQRNLDPFLNFKIVRFIPLIIHIEHHIFIVVNSEVLSFISVSNILILFPIITELI